MKLSSFGNKFTGQSGIVELMDDLGTALSENPDMIFMGGGNPGRVPEVEAVLEQQITRLANDASSRHALLGIYQSPQGDKSFREAVASFLKKQCGWAISEKNIAVTNGSQSAFFMLYNMFAGLMDDGTSRSIHLPLAPEYLGYSDVGLNQGFFKATKPSFEIMEDHLFKYRVDFSNLEIGDSTGALCVSRPTNPTGNVLTDEEMEHLNSIAIENDVPLIIDGAYGLPFPGIIFNNAKPLWNKNTIVVLSLSKLGIPGARTGIIVAEETIIQGFANANTIMNLACGTLGPALTTSLFKDNIVLELSQKHVRPFYEDKAMQTLQWLRSELKDIPFKIHKPEGAIFLWLWFEGLPISSQELYERLKNRGVLIIPGHNFFVGIDEDWSHKHECIRLSYAQDEKVIKEGIRILAEELALAYSSN